MSATSRALDAAAKFQARIPAHLTDDAMLKSVVEQLANGGVFSANSIVFITDYMRTATKPMTQDEYLNALKKALS